MYEGKTGTLFAKYAIPQMIGLLFNSIYLIVDGIFIGNRLGREAMAAAAASVPFIEILIALAMAVASGAGIIISNCIGRAQKETAVRTFNVAVVCCVTLGLLVAALGNALLDPLAEALGSTPAIHAQATQYLWYIVTFSPFLLLSFLLGGLARNDGRPKLAMFALAFGSVSNIVLDYVFMYPLDMGIAGAALATALGPIFSVLILLPHFLRGAATCALQGRSRACASSGASSCWAFPPSSWNLPSASSPLCTTSPSQGMATARSGSPHIWSSGI